jgi:hypothetical protein
MTIDVVDVHAHAFPNFLADRAVAFLSEKGSATAFLDGRLSNLLASMDRAGIAHSVVCTIATEPRQFKSILLWSKEIAGERITPFPSVHPRSPDALAELAEVSAAGLRGIKLHPEYQDFHIDEPELADYYGTAEKMGLIILFHAGFDDGFPESDRSSPSRIAQVRKSFPDLPIVASHLGGFRQWEEALRFLVGKDVYLDTSYVFNYIPGEILKTIITGHRSDRLLFGSDSPWTDQKESLRRLRELDLDDTLERKILSLNARELLGL